MTSSDKQKSSKQEHVIHDYLQGLLQEVTESEKGLPYAQTEVEEKLQSKTLGLEALIAEIPDIVIQPEIAVEAKIAKKPAVVAKTVAKKITPVSKNISTVETTNKKEKVLSNISPVPDWAQQSFQCLLFKVSGLTLAVPLTKLYGVLPWPEKITETPNQTDWFLGLVPNQDINVKIIDTALLVVPENRRSAISQSLEERFSHIILVDEGRWGLSCDTIGDVIWLDKEKVKWRENKQRRPWLEGTALDYLCALLNTDAFAEMLNEKTTA